MNNVNDYIFLLGGYDLEMVVIRDILLKGNHYVMDNRLSWNNSVWEEYSSVLGYKENNDKIFVGIELRETDNYKKPDTAILIDHHGEFSSRPSALEQIIQLIDYKPVNAEEQRFIDLVTANDSGHIKAMKEINATEEDIQKIRLADRAAQGVTNEEEKNAEMDIQKAKKENGVTVVYTNINHFSAVTDRLETEKLLVHSDTKLCYYGTGANSLVKDAFEDLIKEGKAYYGGSGEGFFGMAEDAVGKDELKRIKDKILTLCYSKVISKHIFLFPFKWEVKGNKPFSETSLSERTDLVKLEKSISVNWEKFNFKIVQAAGTGEPNPYNEYSYFYDHIRPVLNLEPVLDLEIDNKSYQYKYPLSTNCIYKIHILGEYPLELNIGTYTIFGWR